MKRQRWRESSSQWSQQSGGFAFSFLLIVLLFIYFIVHIHGLPYENSTYVCDNHVSWHFHLAIWFCGSEYDLPRTRSAMFGGLCTFNWRTIRRSSALLVPTHLSPHTWIHRRENSASWGQSSNLKFSPLLPTATAKQPVKLRSFSSPSFQRVLSHAQSCEKEMLHRQVKKYLSGEALLGPPQSVTSRSYFFVQSHLYTGNHSSNLTIKIN